MVQIIALIILVISVAGISFIIRKKIPLLMALPKNGHHGLKKPVAIARIEKKLRAHHFHFFKKQMLLHKLLSVARIWTLKAERRIDQVLHGIRKKAQELDKKKK